MFVSIKKKKWKKQVLSCHLCVYQLHLFCTGSSPEAGSAGDTQQQEIQTL